MKGWLAVFRYEVRQQFRRKGYLFVTFGVPLLAFAIFFGYRAYQDATREEDKPAPIVESLNEAGKTIGYVDLTPDGLFPAPLSYPEVKCLPTADEIDALRSGAGGSALRSRAIKRISSPYCLSQIVVAFPALDEAERALDAGEIDVLYVIEPDYAQTGEVSVYSSGFSLEAADTQTVMEDYLIRSILHRVEAGAYESLYLRLRDPAFVVEHRITEAGAAQEQNKDADFVLVYGFGLLMMLSIFWGGGYLMQSVVQEKESRVVEIVLSSVRPTALLLGKILAMGLLSLLQVATLIGTFVVLGGQAGDLFEALGDLEVGAGMLVLLAVYFVLGFLLYGSLMAAIGALSTSMRESQNLISVVTLPAAVPFFFLPLFVEEPNGTLAVVLSLFPITAPLSMAMRLAVIDVPAVQLGLGIALLVLGVAGAIWLAGRLFRVNTLLMGRLPRLRDLPTLIRG